MNRITALTATAGLAVAATLLLGASPAAAYPIRDVNPPCPTVTSRTPVALVASHYARYFSLADVEAGDVNGNGAICVLRLADVLQQRGSLAAAPIVFVDDSAA